MAIVLAHSDDQPKSTYWCRKKGGGLQLRSWTASLFRQLRPASAAPSPSSAAQKYTPPGTVATASSSTQQYSTQDSAASGSVAAGPSQSHGPKPSTPGPQAHTSTPSPVVQTDSWILFGVQGASRILKPSQIPVSHQMTDYSLFQELKKCYQSRRGRPRLWFSIWRLEYCESVKVWCYSNCSCQPLTALVSSADSHLCIWCGTTETFQRIKTTSTGLVLEHPMPETPPFRLISSKRCSTPAKPLAPGRFLMTAYLHPQARRISSGSQSENGASRETKLLPFGDLKLCLRCPSFTSSRIIS